MKNKRWIYYIIVVVVAIVAVSLGIGIANFGKKTTADKTNTKEIQETKTKDDGEETAASDDGPKKGYTMVDVSVWTTDTVNLRADDNTDAEVLAKVPRREKLHCIATGSEWYQVQYEEKTGYVSAAYLTTEEPAANSYVVVIDPGHQGRGDSTTEPNGPGSATMKARVAGGTHGTTTGVYEYEYELTLAISQQLQTELQNRGYTVYMTRTSHDVNISNMERAQYATSVGADIAVRIHANGAENASVSGAMALAPSSSNPYISYLSGSSWNLSQCVLNSYCQATGMRNQGVTGSDTMTGINWSTVPVTILEMGYMTNPTDDTNMENPSYQMQMVQGIANGIDAYFGL